METATHHHPFTTYGTASERSVYAIKEKALMMSKLSRMILFFYVLSLFRPLVPVASDLIAHTFYEQQHILQVHEVDGKFHVHNEIGKALHHGDHEKGDAVNYDTVEYSHVQTFVSTFIRPMASSTLYHDVASYILHISIDIDSPPPCSQQVAIV